MFSDLNLFEFVCKCSINAGLYNGNVFAFFSLNEICEVTCYNNMANTKRW